MPKITIYVPDDLKARMDKAEAIEPAPNWSGLAQEAFGLECDRAETRRKGAGKMNAMVERLQKSKARVSNQDNNIGYGAGHTWAQNLAEYDELLRLRDLTTGEGWYYDDETSARAIVEAVQDDGSPSGRDIVEWWENNAGSAAPSLDLIKGFVDGALEAFAEVEDQLD